MTSTIKSSEIFTNDRFQNSAAALNFNGGYYSVPKGYYFTGDFTITFWGRIHNVETIFLCFSNGGYTDGIFLTTLKPHAVFRFNVNNGSSASPIISTNSIQLNTWYHFAITLYRTNASIFINGSMIANGKTSIPNKVVRDYHYFGTNIFKVPSDAEIDFIKFYNRSLSSTAIREESNQIFSKILN